MKHKLFCIAVRSEEALSPEILGAVDYVILCPERYELNAVKGFLRSFKSMTAGSKGAENKREEPEAYLDLPAAAMSVDIAVLRSVLSDREVKEGLGGIVANNAYALRLAEEYGYSVFTGIGMNTLNNNFCVSGNALLSPEIGEPEYRLFSDWDKRNYFLCVYGRLPLMTLAHCPNLLNGFDCKSCGGVSLQYKDELNNVMDIRRTKMHNCYFELLNSVPLNLLNRKNKVKPHFYFDMRGTAKAEILKILRLFKEPGNKEPEGKYTTGLYFKTVK